MPWTCLGSYVELRIMSRDVDSVPYSGAADDAIAALLKKPYIARQLDRYAPAVIAEELRGYGAWDAAELADHDANRARALWIAVGNIQEESRL